MARERKKPAASAPSAPEPQAPAPVPVTEAPDVFDQAIAAQQLPPPAPSPEPPTAAFADRVGRPDPFPEITVSLTADPAGPKARLYRNQRFQQMAIQFDEKPTDEIRKRLRDAEWTWRGQDGVWTKQLGDRPGLTHRQAEELFESVTNDIRQANGLPPAAGPAQSR
jgi:hypothetical protein